MAASYNPELHEAPLVIGHPESNMPAYGWVKGVSAQNGHLYIAPHEVAPGFAEIVVNKHYKKRSASFYAPDNPNNPTPGRWHLKHVGFLGATPPAIKGLKDIQFSETDGVICFSESIQQQKDTHMPDPIIPPASAPAAAPGADQQAQLQAQVAQLQQRINEQQQQIQTLTAERDAALAAQKTAEDRLAALNQADEQKQQAELAQFAEGLVKEGKIKPADKAITLVNLQIAAKAKPVEFSEGDIKRTVNPLEALKTQLDSLPSQAPQFGEWQPATGKAPTGASDKMSAGELNARAEQYQRQHGVSFMEALGKVSNGTTFTK